MLIFVRTQTRVRDAEDTLARLYSQRWMLTSDLTMLEMQVQTAMIDKALREVESRRQVFFSYTILVQDLQSLSHLSTCSSVPAVVKYRCYLL
jgi:hypothetical protein